MSMAGELHRSAELLSAIRTAARDELRRSGAAGLPLRAVARDVGIAASALYRYFRAATSC
jgi:AcrR family transcriptional regulator